jgi:hypothetical protein
VAPPAAAHSPIKQLERCPHCSSPSDQPVAQQVLDSLMSFWRTEACTYLLATALAVYVLNALWSIYIRRYLRLPAWELAQLSLGLSIPPLLMLHVVSTKISDRFLGRCPTTSFSSSTSSSTK